MSRSWDASVFDGIYAREADPWGVETSAYERDKYAATLAALPAPRFASGLEIGCSIGAQTVLLAQRCDRLLAVDFAGAAVARTRERCAGLANVEVRQARIPRDWPAGRFDLIVLSEVLYFFSAEDISLTACQAMDSLCAGGGVLLVNWTGATDTPNSGIQASKAFVEATAGRLVPTIDEARDLYRIDLLLDPRR